MLHLFSYSGWQKVWFTTNLARPLNEDVFIGWAKSGIKHINVSLDTMKPDVFEVLRKFGRFQVFKANLDTMVNVFRRFPNSPKIRYITMAFKSNMNEIPSIVEYSHQNWLASENEIRYTYNVAHITDDFRKQHYLHKEEWGALSKALEPLPYHYVVVYPPDEGYEETIHLSANYFDVTKIEAPHRTPAFDLPLSLRARPDGTLMVVGRENQFRVNIHSLTDPVQFFRRLSCGTNQSIPTASNSAFSALTNSASKEAVMGVIDAPKGGSTVSGKFIVGGWAFARSGAIQAIIVAVDGQDVAVAIVGGRRPDVGKAFPTDPGAAHSGWNTILDVKDLSIGEHQLEVRLKLSDGTTWTLGTAAINVTQGQLAEEAANETRAARQAELTGKGSSLSVVTAQPN